MIAVDVKNTKTVKVDIITKDHMTIEPHGTSMYFPASMEQVEEAVDKIISENPERFRGERGADGINGRDGVDGKDGKDGINGVNGIDGAKGDKGDKGDTGEQGPKGDKGDKGDSYVLTSADKTQIANTTVSMIQPILEELTYAKHTHSNKKILDGITKAPITEQVTDAHINALIDAKLGVIEDGSY